MRSLRSVRAPDRAPELADAAEALRAAGAAADHSPRSAVGRSGLLSPRLAAAMAAVLAVGYAPWSPNPPWAVLDAGWKIGLDTFDILGHDQYLLAGLPTRPWAPRPVMQSYSAYSPRLADMNLQHLLSPAGPRQLIVRLATLDNRLPAFDEALLWPVIGRYLGTSRRAGDCLILSRHKNALNSAVQPDAVRLVGYDWIGMPPGLDDGLWARIEVEVT